MKVLITGGTGFIGAELARVLVNRGEDVVLFDITPNFARINDIKDKVKVVQGNIVYGAEVFDVVKDNKIEGIYHLGSMLSVPSNANPWAAFDVNVVGTMNILEAARLFGVGKLIFTSSLTTYGLATPPVITDETIQRPTTMLGCCKLYCECLGRFYRSRFGLDFRSVRFPAVTGPGVRTPGVVQYNAWMIEYPALGEPYECFVSEDTRFPVIYFKDAAKSLDMLFHSSKEQIKTINYNICGPTVSSTAKEVELLVKKYIPKAQISYKPDPKVMDFHRSLSIEAFDDSRARQEWGWQPTYSDFEKIVLDTIEELRVHPERYGIAKRR